MNSNVSKNCALLMGLLCWTLHTHAAPGTPTSDAEVTAIPDIRIVIDVSGSMKRTDPENLRVPALRLLTAQLPDRSYAGVWSFGRYVNMLVKHGEVNADWKRSALAAASKIQSNALWTNIGDALKQASWDIDKPARGRARHILLLTDGRVDISEDPAENRVQQHDILTQLLPQLIEAGFKVHTLALSREADTSFLRQLSLATDGYNGVVETASDLMPFFLKVLDQAAPSEQVPLGKDNRFQIDQGIDEFTLLVFREPGSPGILLQSPLGTRLSPTTVGGGSVNWYQDERYDLVTVRSPQSGMWQIHGPENDANRVTIVTDLKLKASRLPPSVFGDFADTMTIQLLEDDKPIVNADLLSLVEMQATLVSPGGQRELVVTPPVDGVFRLQISGFEAPGDYELRIQALGKTFERAVTQSTTLRDPLQIDVQPDAEGRANIFVGISEASIDYETVRVVGKVNLGNRDRLLVGSRIPSGDWRLPLDIKEGEVTVSLTIRGAYLTGQDFSVTPEPLQISLPLLQPATVGMNMEGKPILRLPEADDSNPGVPPSLSTASPKAVSAPQLTKEPGRSIEVEPKSPQLAVKLPTWLLWSVVALINLLLLAGVWFAFRTPSSKTQASGQASEQSSEEGADQESAENSAEESEKAARFADSLDQGLGETLENFQILLQQKSQERAGEPEAKAA